MPSSVEMRRNERHKAVVSSILRPAPRVRTRALALALSAAALVGCDAGEAGAPAAREQPPAPVEVAAARGGVLVDEWTFIGEVRSLRSASLALGAPGEIVMIEVREGDRVEAGDLLVEIDKRQASARVSAAVSNRRESERELEQARREADRAAGLGEILASEVIERGTARADSLEARKRRLAAEILAAKAQLSDYQLLAPFAGVISARRADLGQWVDPGEAVLELVASEALELLVEVRPELASQLRVGDRVPLRPAASMVGLGAGGDVLQSEAEIVGVVPSLDPDTRTIEVRLRPLEVQAWLLPGAPVEIAFPVRYQTASGSPAGSGDPAVASIAGAVIVPRDALVLGAVDIRVILVVDGKAKPVQVEVRASVGEEALVLAPELTPGSEVVVRGNERLRPGQAVRVLEAGADAGAQGGGS